MYDPNFCFPIPEALENDRVKLVPFIPSKHTKPLFEAALPHPEAFHYLPVGPFTSPNDVISSFYEPIIHNNPGFILFILIDKTRRPLVSDAETREAVLGEGTIAGHMAYINASPHNLAIEIGYILILPPFQRTHVTSNAVGLMMHYALDLPGRGGLGLRRVFWQANALNKPSMRLAERMGFRFEGILRWDRVLPENKVPFGNGVQVREEDPRRECPGRDTAMFAHCWDDWEGGGREKVDVIMARVC